MKNIFLIILSSISFSGLVSCKKINGISLPADKKEYAGTWLSKDSVCLIINKDGKVKYTNRLKGKKYIQTSIEIEAPLQKFEEKTFVVGALGMEQPFTITMPPRKINTKWVMVIDRDTLVKTK